MTQQSTAKQRVRRLRGRAQLQAYLNFGTFMRTLAPGEKLNVDRGIVVETWKAVADGQHNSNTDMTFWNRHFYLCHQASPFHLGTSRSRMRLWRSADAHSWELVREFVGRPLVELRDAVADELMRKQTTEAMVPIDREPVPPQYVDKVKEYYERLGAGRSYSAR